MKAITFNPHTDQFHLSDIPDPKIGENDVLIKVAACGLNPVDAKIKFWKSMLPDMAKDFVPGLDVSGEIVEVGNQVEKWKTGDQVLCHGNMFRPHGGFAELTVQDADILIPHPNVSVALAASTPCAGWTAWRSLVDRLHIQHKNSVLIAGGSGGVGSFAVQIASHFNLEKIITTTSAKNFEFVKSLGATDIIDYHNENIVDRVMEITSNNGVEIGFDTVGGGNDVFVADSLAFEGQMVEIVGLVKPDQYKNAFAYGLGFHQLSLGSGHRFGSKSKKELRDAGKAFTNLIEDGTIKVPHLKTISIDETGDTLVEMLNQRTVGKIVMKF